MSESDHSDADFATITATQSSTNTDTEVQPLFLLPPNLTGIARDKQIQRDAIRAARTKNSSRH